MKTIFYDLGGGINQSSTKTELGTNLSQIYWADSKNIEILQNKGIIRQNGNTLFKQLPVQEKIIAVHQMKYEKIYNLLIVTGTGKLFIFNPKNQLLKQLDKTVSEPSRLNFADFLNGVVVASQSDAMFFIKNNNTFDIVDCNLKRSDGTVVKSDVIVVHKSRIWVADESSIYFSALGTYNDFTTVDDAGYIHDFYTDTDDIVALKPFKDYLAIYKKHMVYLLTGSNTSDFAITPFADKGTTSFSSVINVNNKQYFLNQGVFSLETGDLNQIQLGDEITLKIKQEFNLFDKTAFDKVIILHYEKKNQVWYFIPYKNDEYFHTIWINDYINNAWFKRVVPQNIISACIFDDDILTADENGKIYKEDSGPNFNGQTINFMWKSPFIALGESNIRKTIDEFYFILDESYDNNFHFSVYKNYDSDYKDDLELIYSSNFDNLSWHNDNALSEQNFYWDSDTESSLWAVNVESVYKAEISESNYSVQLCVEGTSAEQNAAIIGLEFKEIFVDE